MRFVLVLLLFFSTSIISQNISISSEFLKENREIKIHLPEYYDQSKTNYPVIYVFDGQVLFDYVVGLAKYNYDIYPECIIIGVIQEERDKELVNLGKDSKNKLFSDFINKELMPKISSDYRTVGVNIFLGHSFGGAFVLNEFFDTKNSIAISISPSLGKKQYNNLMKKVVPKKGFESLYIGYGGNESKGFKDVSKNLRKDIKNVKLKVVEFDEENHNSSVLIGFRKGLGFIFNNWFLNFPEDDWDTIEEENKPEIFYTYFKNVSKKLNTKIFPSEEDLNYFGYYFVGKKQYKKAIEIFKENISRHPYSSNTYDSLAETYLTVNDKKNAITFYEKAIMVEKKTSNQQMLIKEVKNKIKKIKE